MFTALLQRMRKDEKGFTLIELLVVILIIGILAAIALPTFLGQQDKGKDASAKSDVRNAVTKMESCLVDDNFTNCKAKADFTKFAPAVNDTTGYKLTATSDSSKATTFSIAKDSTGAYTRSCSNPGEGGCRTGGSW